jgi:glycosyltransferase involved in cell wall biosynthesis
MATYEKKVLMLGPSMVSHGGIASVIRTWRDAGLFDEFNIDFVPTHIEGTPAQKMTVAICACWKVFSETVRGRVRCVHAHVATKNSFWRKSILMMMALTLRTPYIVHLHSGRFNQFYFEDCRPLGRSVVRFVLLHASEVIVLTEAWRDDLRRIGCVDHVSVLPNFIDQGWIADKLRGSAEGYFLFLGQLTKNKGFFDLIELWQRLVATGGAYELWCGGDGDLETIGEILRGSGLQNHVRLLGWIDGERKKEMIRGARGFLLPSYFEGLPMGVLEAMAQGTPVVASAVGGIPDLIRDGVDGLLVSAGDLDKLETAVRTLMEDDVVRERLRDSALERVRNGFSVDAFRPKLAALYSTVP